MVEHIKADFSAGPGDQKIMAKAYLISPPYGEVYNIMNFKEVGGVAQPPLGLAYVAGYLAGKGHDVKLFDGAFSRDILKDIKEHLLEFGSDMVGITATTPQITHVFRIAEFVKSVNPKIRVVVGGPHASALPKETAADKNIDIVVYGEGEITMSELLEGKPISGIKGICFRENGKIILNPPRPLIEDLDTVPFPLLDQLPLERYYNFFPEIGASVLSGRGCPYSCSFCASSLINQRRYRMRSPENFVNEIEWIYKKFGIRNFIFCDETFTANASRTVKICDMILERKLPVKWFCMTRANTLTKKLLEHMKKAGCYAVELGIESGDSGILKAAGKQITLEQVENAVKWARQTGIKAVGFFILGLPYETPQTLKRTLAFAKKLKLYYAQFSMLVPLPGTAVWDMVRDGKVLRCTATGWDHYTRYDRAIVESESLSAQDLTKYYRSALRSFYLDPAFIFCAVLNIRSLGELKAYWKKGGALFRMLFRKR